MPKVAARGVPVEDLNQEQIDCLDGSQQTLTELVVDGRAHLQDRRGRNELTVVVLDLLKRRAYCDHPWSPS